MRSPAAATRYALPATRHGFTLVEVLVALVLLSCGALAVVAASAMAIRATSAAESQGAATLAARNRVELLASMVCSSPRDTAGADSSGSLREWWAVRGSRNATHLVTDSVAYGAGAVGDTIVLHRLVVC